MILEIVNPSDAVTIEADDVTVAGVCTFLLSRGACGLKNEQGETVFPILMFGGFEDWLKENGITDLDMWITNHKDEMIKVLESVVYGNIGSRKLFQSAIEKMTSENAAKYREEWNDKKRSSMTNIGAAYLAYAKKLRALKE